MRRTEAILLIVAEGIVGALLVAAAWLAPNVGPGASLVMTATVLAALFFAWAATWGGFKGL